LEEMLTVAGAAHDTPQQHVSDIAGDLLWIRVEAVGFGTDVADVAFSFEGEDV
jgi:hypothetical protein